MDHPEGESMKVGFDGGIKLEFHEEVFSPMPSSDILELC